MHTHSTDGDALRSKYAPTRRRADAEWCGRGSGACSFWKFTARTLPAAAAAARPRFAATASQSSYTNSRALRDRRHDFLLSCRLSSLTDSNIITRQLRKDSYWQIFHSSWPANYGWPAKMGLVPFRQPSTWFCCCHLVLHIFCCIVENKPLSLII